MQHLTSLITKHGFILATSVAMFIHSTWSFNTVFAGPQPAAETEPIRFLLWVIPGALIAAAIDIGQVQTSARLMHAQTRYRRISLGFTFTTLALAGYYLQWFHLIHHMPALELGAGLSEGTKASVTWARDAAIYIIPALLPLSTILYTISEAGLSENKEQPRTSAEETTQSLNPFVVNSKANGHKARAQDPV